MAVFLDATLGGLLGSSVTTALLGALFLRRNKTIESKIKTQFDQGFKVFESTRSWKEQSLSELLGPLQMQLERTKRAFERWDKKNLHLEGEVIRKGNMAIRDLLLGKGHLIPPGLMNHAVDLVEHYDYWLEAYDRIRGESSENEDSDFVFVGPEGYLFPVEAEKQFKAEFRKLQNELYGV
jgi:hypothetical protein